MTPSSQKAIVAIVILVVFGSFGTYLRSSQVMPESGPVFSQIPYEEFGFYGTEHRFDEYAYDVLRADTTTLRMYRDSDNGSYWLFMAYFSSQKYGSQIHSPKHCLPGGGFRIETIEPYQITLADGTILTINRLLIANPQRKELMMYWFETRGGIISSEFGLKFDLMRNAMMLRPTDAAICRLTMPLPLSADFNEATNRAVSFIKQFYPSIKSSLPFE
ncbi:MAG: EpsI family protein [candidate division Zixibacteria bacterium]|nr:EpsI family protein [candidate division Zixibacteria bacterium]